MGRQATDLNSKRSSSNWGSLETGNDLICKLLTRVEQCKSMLPKQTAGQSSVIEISLHKHLNYSFSLREKEPIWNLKKAQFCRNAALKSRRIDGPEV